MAALLTLAAAVVAIYLVLSAIGSASRWSQPARESNGPWGIASFSSRRHRPLNPQERRWQTLILSGKDNPARWRDLLAELERLDRSAGAAQHSAWPDRFDSGWIDTRIEELEGRVNHPSSPGESTR